IRPISTFFGEFKEFQTRILHRMQPSTWNLSRSRLTAPQLESAPALSARFKSHGASRPLPPALALSLPGNQYYQPLNRHEKIAPHCNPHYRPGGRMAFLCAVRLLLASKAHEDQSI